MFNQNLMRKVLYLNIACYLKSMTIILKIVFKFFNIRIFLSFKCYKN